MYLSTALLALAPAALAVNLNADFGGTTTMVSDAPITLPGGTTPPAQATTPPTPTTLVVSDTAAAAAAAGTDSATVSVVTSVVPGGPMISDTGSMTTMEVKSSLHFGPGPVVTNGINSTASSDGGGAAAGNQTANTMPLSSSAVPTTGSGKQWKAGIEFVGIAVAGAGLVLL